MLFNGVVNLSMKLRSYMAKVNFFVVYHDSRPRALPSDIANCIKQMTGERRANEA
jgi:hypothetical protein